MKYAILLSVGLLASCKQQAPAPQPTPTSFVSVPRALVAADYDTLELGARIDGFDGNEVETAISVGPSQIGNMVSFVHCPKGTTQCNPPDMPEGTVYTFVNQITLGGVPEETAEATPVPAVSGAPVETGAILFRTTEPVPGFNHAIGYSRSQAEAALGSPDAIEISSDEGQLIWRVTKGQGWKPGSTITFWWTSTNAPLTLEKAFAFKLGNETASIVAPFPAEDKSVEGGEQR